MKPLLATPLVALALAAPAGAAYDPRFTLTVEPGTASTAAAITSTITQAPGEDPGKTVRVTLPPGFGPNPATRLTACEPADEARMACPAGSRMGTATAVADAFGLTPTLSGPVFWGGLAGGDFRLVSFLTGDPVFGAQKIVGLAGLRGDGSLETVFDDLPPILVTSFTLALDGGERSLIRTPATCGDSQISALFTSHQGQQVSRTAPLSITGCGAGAGAGAPATTTTPSTPGATPALRLGAPRLSRAGRLTFTLSAPGRVTVTVTRAGRRVARRVVTGRTGTNRLRLRRLRPGRYVVTMTAANGVRRRTVLRVR
jgi:hypothetical protein